MQLILRQMARATYTVHVTSLCDCALWKRLAEQLLVLQTRVSHHTLVEGGTED